MVWHDKEALQDVELSIDDSPLCSVNIFDPISRPSFGTLDLIRLALIDVPAPKVLAEVLSFTCCAPIAIAQQCRESTIHSFFFYTRFIINSFNETQCKLTQFFLHKNFFLYSTSSGLLLLFDGNQFFSPTINYTLSIAQFSLKNLIKIDTLIC